MISFTTGLWWVPNPSSIIIIILLKKEIFALKWVHSLIQWIHSYSSHSPNTHKYLTCTYTPNLGIFGPFSLTSDKLNLPISWTFFSVPWRFNLSGVDCICKTAPSLQQTTYILSFVSFRLSFIPRVRWCWVGWRVWLELEIWEWFFTYVTPYHLHPHPFPHPPHTHKSLSHPRLWILNFLYIKHLLVDLQNFPQPW